MCMGSVVVMLAGSLRVSLDLIPITQCSDNSVPASI